MTLLVSALVFSDARICLARFRSGFVVRFTSDALALFTGSRASIGVCVICCKQMAQMARIYLGRPCAQWLRRWICFRLTHQALPSARCDARPAIAVVVSCFGIDPQIQIVTGEGMATRACLNPSPPHVFGLGHLFKVGRSEARRIAADVIQLMSVLHVPIGYLVSEPMRQMRATPKGHDTVSLRVLVPSPNPASIWRFIAHEAKAFIECKPADSLAHTLNSTILDMAAA